MEPSLWQILILVIVAALWVIPLWKILPRTGMPAWLALLTIIPGIGPMIGLVLIWVVAFKTWPSERVDERFS